MKKIFKNYKFFFIVYVLFLLIVGIILVAYTKEESFLFVNKVHNPVADIFFKWLTHLGDGLFFIVIILGLALFRYRLSLLGLIIFLSSSLFAQMLKMGWFDKVKRPVAHFGNEVDIHFVEGVTRHIKNSFPSGHATTAFALAIFLMLAFKLKKYSWLMAILAILVGYSRVYLAVHFPVDVYFGSLIGTFSAVIFYTWLNDRFEIRFGDKGLMTKR